MKAKKENISNKKERQLVNVVNGRTPKTKFEKKLKKDVDDIRKKGGIVEVPSDI